MCIYWIDEKFHALYFGCTIGYVCINNLCPHIYCSSYLRFSRNWWLKVLHSFMSSFLRPYEKSTFGPPILFAQVPSWYYCPTYTKNLPNWCLYLWFFHKICVSICIFFVACYSAPVIYSSLILLLFKEEYNPYFTYNVIFLTCLLFLSS